MKCVKCAKTIPDGSLYCNHCGKKQTAVPRADLKIPAARQYSSGNWYIQMRLNGVSTTIKRPTERECIDAARIIKAEYLSGKRDSKNRPTLRQAEKKYIDDRRNVLSPASVAGYENISRNRFKDYADKPLERIDWTEAINAERKVCSARTIQNAWLFVVSVLKANDLPVPKVNLPQVIKSDRPYLDPDQIKDFVELVSGTTVAIPALLALHSLRRSELLALKWEDVDLARRELHVRGAIVAGSDGLVEKPENKTVSSRRTVPIMTDALFDALVAVPVKAGRVVTDSPHTIYKRINRLCKDAGLPQIGFHGLRHSFASLGFYLNVSEDVIRLIGGWTGRDVVHDVYTHLSDKQRIHEINEITDFFAIKNAM